MSKELKLEAASIACDEHKLFPIGTRVKLRNEAIFGGSGLVAIPPLAAQKDCEDRGLYCIEITKNHLIYRTHGEVVAI